MSANLLLNLLKQVWENSMNLISIGACMLDSIYHN